MKQQDENELGNVRLQDPSVRLRLEELFRFAQVGDHVNGVTHDINNFLGAMMAYTELVGMDEGLSDQSRKMMENVMTSVRRSSQLLGQLTAIARPNLHTTSIFDLADLLRCALEIRDYDFNIAQVHTTLEVDERIPSLCGEVARMQLCIGYLLSNAFEAVRPLENREIRIQATRHDEIIRIVIWNSELDILTELREKIFQPFFTTKTGQHLGLGLYCAQQIAREHGGDIRYEPDAGFLLEIPVMTPFQTHMYA